jgi:hypothetical protein
MPPALAISEPAHSVFCEVSPDDRLPTCSEIEQFDASSAWDRLTAEQQRAVGVLAVRFGTLGQINTYVQTKGWPEAQRDHLDVLEQETMTALLVGIEPLWADLFGWRGH